MASVQQPAKQAALANKIHTALIAGDSSCLVSGAYFEECQPCFILPISRPENYSGLWRNPIDLYKPSHALLLREDHKRSFEECKWGLHRDEHDKQIVHFFEYHATGRAEFHGKVIDDRERYRCSDHTYPIHYQQCAIRRFRGWPAGF
ncbi:hypothetical protein OC835_007363 [Tilletia horrida]|nr:hypothetical protein OC835_007363 [Tilletia horrida]